MSEQSNSNLPGPVDVVLREAAATGGVNGIVMVFDEPTAALVAATVAAGASEVLAHCDTGFAVPLPRGAREVDLDALAPENGTVALAVGVLPKSLAELAEISQRVASQLPEARLILGGREKHLVRSMNEVLAESYAQVRASRGHRKSRALVAAAPRTPVPSIFPVADRIPDYDLEVRAFGGAFAGATLDIGTRALLEQLESRYGDTAGRTDVPSTVVDLGCGTGVLASWAARRWPQARVIATDRSAAAVRSARATAAANGLSIGVVRADAGADIAAGCADLVLLNPPFHAGREVDPAVANRMFAGAARLLRPGGELLTVYNSHLRHRPHLERLVGPTEQLSRNEKFIVTRSAAPR